MQQIFEPFGTIKDVVIPKNPDTQKSSDYGYVYFEKLEDATKAAKEMNDFLLYGNNIIVTVVKNVSTSFFGRDSMPLTKPTEPGTDLSKSLLNIGDIRQALGTSMDYGSDKAKLVTASMFQQNINNTTCKVKQSIPSRILLLYNMISKEELAVWSLSEW